MKKNHVCSICRKCPRKTHIHWFVKSFLSEQFLFAVLVFIPNTKNLYSSSIKICWLRLFPSTFQNYQRKKVRFPAYNERAFHTPEPFVSAVWAERFVRDAYLLEGESLFCLSNVIEGGKVETILYSEKKTLWNSDSPFLVRNPLSSGDSSL
mmetsp:Transcript_340/g.359  ORF Transcript_340/g.359 Transcript_340/m.359 type:complete len:151 (-) Transcript_340:305-757(-)